MKKTSLALAASLFSLILVGCSSSSTVVGSVPEEHLAAVEAAKTIKDPIEFVREEVIDASSNIEPKQIKINGEVVPDAPYRFSDLQNGLNTLPIEVTYGPKSGSGSQLSGTISGNLFIYEQPYSMVIGSVVTGDSGPLTDADDLNVHEVVDVMGLRTRRSVINALSTAGTVATYTGRAFDGKQQGNLSYEVNFGTREGWGTITGLTEPGTVNLLSARIVNGRISGEAKFANAQNADVDYELGFFGPNAEEIAGGVFVDDDDFDDMNDIGFGGARSMP